MANLRPDTIADGEKCVVISGTHKGKSGIATALNSSKTGYLTMTVLQGCPV